MAEKKTTKTTKKYIEGVGRRKTATARVRIEPSTKGDKFEINDQSIKEYFAIPKNQKEAQAPFNLVDKKFDVSVKVQGGGPNAQAEAIRHGLSRALVKDDEENRAKLKPYGYLTRDPRMKERKKPGLKKARRAKQWRKR